MKTRTFVVGLGLAFGGCAATAFIGYQLHISGWRSFEEIVRDKLSPFLMRQAELPAIKPELLRSQFTDLDVGPNRPVQNHTHPRAAAERSYGSLFCSVYSSHVQLPAYYVQRSRADERHYRDGCRSYFWAKDLSAQPSPMDMEPESLPVFIDVDHYVNMPRFMCQNFRPMLVYTFQPEQVARAAKPGSDYSYTFNRDNEVVYLVNGGGSYKHMVWNYGTDSLKVTRKVLGIPIQVAVYLVDRRAAGQDHQLVLLVPVARWSGVMALLADWISGPALARLKPVQGDYLRMLVASSAGLRMSTGAVGKFICSNIPAADDDAMSLLAETMTHGIDRAMIRSFLSTDVSGVESAVLLPYHKSKSKRTTPIVYPVEECVRRYQVTQDPDPDAKPSLVAFMSAIINGSFAPDKCLSNEKACIKGRITDVKSQVTPTPFLVKVMHEFAVQFIPHPGCLVPVPVEEVFARQPRPTQRHILENASAMNRTDEGMKHRRIIKMFQKAESYAGPKDPRPISTICGEDKLDYSAYMYALAEHVKTMPWYAFSRSPREIAARVVEIA
jgi:hypothetical protein